MIKIKRLFDQLVIFAVLIAAVFGMTDIAIGKKPPPVVMETSQ